MGNFALFDMMLLDNTVNFMNYLLVVLGFAVMVVMLKYRRHVKNFTGDIAWAEKYLGSGGTNTLVVIIAVLVFILSLMYALGTIQTILQSTIGKFF